MESYAPGPAPRRNLRDWAVDSGLFLLAAGFWVLATGARLEPPGPPDPLWWFALEEAVGAAGCVALWLRRRLPVAVAVALAVLGVFSELSGVALLAALFTVAVNRPPRTTGWVFALSLLAPVSHLVFGAGSGASGVTGFGIGAAFLSGATGWGLFVRQRRLLVLSLRDRAERAESETRLRAEQAELRAREAIAREMHDVLGHRLSLLSVHAGALEFRPDAPTEQVADAARVVRESAHRAMQDLREVVGVLRAPVGEVPRPALGDVESLVAEARSAGTAVAFGDERRGSPPEEVHRIAYRIVQEGLTNVRRHAPGTRALVRLSGAPGEGLEVEVRNTAAPTDSERTATRPGGHGIAGLAERIAAADGDLEYGALAEGGWRLAARLPWPV